MKKFLSLILAVLMIAAVTVTVSADSVNNSDPVGIRDFLSFYSNFYKDDNTSYGFYPYPGFNGYFPGITGDSDIYTSWYGSCPECKGFALFYVVNGSVKWACLEEKCGKRGTISYDNAVDPDPSETSVICPDCKKGDKVIFLETRNNSLTGKVEDVYYCGNCADVFTVTSGTGAGSNVKPIICTDKNCSKTAEFQYYYYSGGALYARYECADHHVSTRKISNYEGITYLYTIRVVTSEGGSYNVYGSETGSYGEEKIINFYPDRGYVLTDVYVNGEPVDVDNNELKIEVKGNTVIRAYFTKISTLRNYNVKATAVGGGKIVAVKNAATVDSSVVSANYTDVVNYRFIPDSDNYYISSVKINGRSVGKSNTYSISKLRGDMTIEVTFSWKSPYEDVADNNKYISAVEYVTEAGILTGTYGDTLSRKFYFNGQNAVSVKMFACALAEMADVKGLLSNNTDRLEWAKNYGLVGEKEDVTPICDVQRACDMVKVYLEVLEDINDISFKNVSDKDSAKETCIAINMITSTTYKNNRNLNKYDLASVMYLIANLPYVD